jgi:hypothetical protein
MSRPANFNKVSAAQAIAICSRKQAEQLAGYDHHWVLVDEKAAVLLTNEWLPLEGHHGPFVLTVVFHHADEHPSAPVEIQSIVDQLNFQFRSQPR